MSGEVREQKESKVLLPDFELQHNLNLTKDKHKPRPKSNNGNVKHYVLDVTIITSFPRPLFILVEDKVTMKFKIRPRNS